MRNYKPERNSSREEDFVPGIDPGLKHWLVVRQAGRDAQMKGSKTSVVTCDVSYKFCQFWRTQLFEYHNRENGTLCEFDNIMGEQNTTLSDFKKMLFTRCSFEDIVTTAMKKKNIAFVDLALDHGIDINDRMGHSRRTMLHTACRDGDIKKVEFLIKKGANVNLRDSHGDTALHLAIQPVSKFHPLDIVELLLHQRDCKVNILNKHGHTPLHTACIVGVKEVIELLLKHHALPNILDKKSKLALDYTRSHLNRHFCECLSLYAVKSHQEKMWAHVIARNVSNAIIRVATPSCEVCTRMLPECLALKKSNYRYWLFAHHRLNKEVFEDRLREESRTFTSQDSDIE